VFVLLHYKVRAVPALLAIYLAGAAALFLVPWNREYMFFRPERVQVEEVVVNPGQLDIDNVNTSGRLTMWPIVLDVLWEPSPLVGSGLGATQSLFYSGQMGLVGQVHSGYVQLLCDVGLVGLVLYLVVILTAMACAWQVWRSPPPGAAVIEKTYASIVLCVMPAFLVCLGFDNCLDYVTTLAQYPFAFVGIMVGSAVGARAAKRARRRIQAPLAARQGLQKLEASVPAPGTNQ
jgi:O-antigen ligase